MGFWPIIKAACYLFLNWRQEKVCQTLFELVYYCICNILPELYSITLKWPFQALYLQDSHDSCWHDEHCQYTDSVGAVWVMLSECHHSWDAWRVVCRVHASETTRGQQKAGPNLKTMQIWLTIFCSLEDLAWTSSRKTYFLFNCFHLKNKKLETKTQC